MGEEGDAQSQQATAAGDGVGDGDGTADRIEVIARHAIQGTEVKVVLPSRARFKHIKKALAKLLDSDEVWERGQLMRKEKGIYSAYKDKDPVGDVREVLVVCTELGSQSGLEVRLGEGDVSEAEERKQGKALGEGAAKEKPATPSRPERIRPGALTRQQAINLQTELMMGFSGDDFQKDLTCLRKQLDDALITPTEFAKERQELFLSVQKPILPKFGFEGSVSGVYKMMGAMGPWVKDPDFVQLANDINDLIGLSSPQDKWASLSKNCQKIDQQPPSQKKPVVKGLGLPGPGGRLGPLGLKGPTIGLSSRFATALPAVPGPQLVGAGPPAPAAQEVGGPSLEADAAAAEEWPADKPPPFKLSVAGSWNDYKPEEMEWQGGVYAAAVTIGRQGFEEFQLLKNGNWNATIYPSIPDATPYEEHAICGPDTRGHGKNWQIGKYADDEAKPGKNFIIVVSLDKSGKVQMVCWQPF